MSFIRNTITGLLLATVFTLAGSMHSAQAAPPKTILLVGASSIEGTLGKELEDRLETYKDVKIIRWGQHSTGLSNPDLLDWHAKLSALIKEHKPDMVIADLGENDCAPVSDSNGPIAKFGTETWEAEYNARVQKFVKIVKDSGAVSVMLGIPTMRDRTFSSQVEQLNEVLKSATESAGGFFLDTWGFTADSKGHYVPSLEFDGKDRMIRASDGVHFSKHGSEYLAFKISEVLESKYGIVSK